MDNSRPVWTPELVKGHFIEMLVQKKKEKEPFQDIDGIWVSGTERAEGREQM